MSEERELSLPVAAFELGESYEVAKRMLFRGELTGRLDSRGRWRVNAESVQRILEARNQPSPTAA